MVPDLKRFEGKFGFLLVDRFDNFVDDLLDDMFDMSTTLCGRD
jgi:hypothetical protein